MYSYLTAYTKPKGRRGRWIETDLRATRIIDLYRNYRRVWLILTHQSLNTDPNAEPTRLLLDMALVQDKILNQNLTVEQWLSENGDRSLPTTREMPTFETRTVTYSDAVRANYDVQTTKPGVHPEAYFPESEKTDLLLSRPGTDYAFFYKHCLVTVNGYIHQTSYSPHGIYVTDGRRSGKIANLTQVGIISFEKVGAITPVPITDSMFYKPRPDAKLRQGAYLKLNQDLTNKTLLLVLGGYLHVLDEAYQMVGDNLVKINLGRLPLVHRLFESRNYIDLASLELPVSDRNPEMVALDDLYSDHSLKAYLKLSQTFFLIVDCPELYVEQHLLEHARLPGRWISYIPPRYPLLKGNGKLEDYVAFHEEDRWVIACDDNLERNYNFDTTEWVFENAVDPTKSTTRPYDYARGYLLEIGREL